MLSKSYVIVKVVEHYSSHVVRDVDFGFGITRSVSRLVYRCDQQSVRCQSAVTYIVAYFIVNTSLLSGGLLF